MGFGLCVLCLWACESPPSPIPQQLSEPLPATENPTALSIETPPLQNQSARVFRSIYHITSEPSEVGVYRELGELVGITPLTIEFQYERITRLTFLKKGYLIQSKIIEPEDGEHRLHVVLVRD